MQALLKARVDVNARQGDGATALHWAAHLDDVRDARSCCFGRARGPALADDTGATPLYLACTNRSAPMVETLLAAGANPNATLAERRDRAHDVLAHRRRDGGEGAAGARRRASTERNRSTIRPR